MRFRRISKPEYALDILCAGSSLFGGRWNPAHMPALYCGASVGICALEKFVYLGPAPQPPLVLVAIDVPDACACFAPGVADLPHGWDAMPASASAQAFGGRWLAAASELYMKVPSVIVPEETNIVINPRHTDYRQLVLTVIRPFSFDARMFK